MKDNYTNFLATRDENPELVRDWTFINTTHTKNCMIDYVESARSRETLTKLSEMVIKKVEGFAEFIKKYDTF